MVFEPWQWCGLEEQQYPCLMWKESSCKECYSRHCPPLFPAITEEDLLCSVRTGCQCCVDVSCSCAPLLARKLASAVCKRNPWHCFDLPLILCSGGRLVCKKTSSFPGGKNYPKNKGKLKMRLESPILVEIGSNKILALLLKLTFLFMKLIGIINQWTLPAML